jgi:hypothetical protein
MGDRYLLTLRCPYCDEINEDIWYAPTCNSMTSTCDYCNETFFIDEKLTTMKIKDVTYEDVEIAIIYTSNFMDDKLIRKTAREYYKNLKKRKK